MKPGTVENPVPGEKEGEAACLKSGVGALGNVASLPAGRG